MRETAPDDVVLTDKPPPSVLSVLYAGAIVVAAVYFGRELFIPLVLACLLAFVLGPACRLLQRIHLPRILAVLIVVVVAFSMIGGVALVIGRQAASLASSLPTYQTTVMTKWDKLSNGGGILARLTRGMSGKTKPPSSAVKSPTKTSGSGLDAALGLANTSELTIARAVAEPLLGPLSTGAIVLVFTIFILLSSEDLRDRLVRLVGRQDLHRTILAMNDAAGRLSRYFLYQLALNTSFGTIIGVSLWLAGLPNPLLWGIFAAIMRFVPYVGVFIALAPPLLLAVATVPGWSLALFVLGMFLVTEMIMGQVVEPLLYGHSTGISPMAVVVATGFWALLWGPIGLLIATPLTVCLVVIGRHVEALSFFHVILGDAPPLEPAETFYQRALEGTAAVLAPAARKQIVKSSLTEYYDTVALPGLALAQGDLARDVMGFERLEAVHQEIEKLLSKLRSIKRRDFGVDQEPVLVSSTWRADGSIICIPARGQLDDLAATMAVQALNSVGFGARMEQNALLGPMEESSRLFAETRLCCLSVLEAGSSVAGIRYFTSRMRKRTPNAIMVLGLWHCARESPLLLALRAHGGEEHLVMSIGELIALSRALSARSAPQNAN